MVSNISITNKGKKCTSTIKLTALLTLCGVFPVIPLMIFLLKYYDRYLRRVKWQRWTKCLNSTLHFHSIQGSKCLSVFKQIAFMERQGGFCLQVAEALVNEQEACHTGAVLLCLSERINLCLSLPTLRASTASRVPQSTGCTSSTPPQAFTHLASSSQDASWVCDCYHH